MERLANLCVMNQAIPSNMMRGIERVASQLMSGIQDGSTDLANLDVEKIGQQVLNDVAEDDVGEFAKNLDNILPALQGMGHTVE